MSRDINLKIDEKGELCLLILDSPLVGILMEDILNALAKNGVKAGIKHQVIEDYLSGKSIIEKNLVIARLKDDLSNNEKNLATLNDHYQSCAQKIVKISKCGSDEIDHFNIKSILEKSKEINAEITKYKERDTIIRSQLDLFKKNYSSLMVKVEFGDAELSVKDVIYNNCIIKIRLNGLLEIKNPIHKATFYLDEEHKIAYREFSNKNSKL